MFSEEDEAVILSHSELSIVLCYTAHACKTFRGRILINLEKLNSWEQLLWSQVYQEQALLRLLLLEIFITEIWEHWMMMILRTVVGCSVLASCSDASPASSPGSSGVASSVGLDTWMQLDTGDTWFRGDKF